MSVQEELERQVLDACLAGQASSRVPKNLDLQRYVESRNVGGSGFFTSFNPDPDMIILSSDISGDLNCVAGRLNDDPQYVDFVVMFKKGALKWIEGFNYSGDPWPAITKFELFAAKPTKLRPVEIGPDMTR